MLLNFSFNQEASRIRLEARTTKDAATKLKEEAEVLSQEVAEAENRLTDYENNVLSDENLIGEVNFVLLIYLHSYAIPSNLIFLYVFY